MTNLHSPLAHVELPAAVANAGVTLREDKFRGHLNLRGNPQDDAFTSAAEKVLGVALPTAPNSAVENGATRVYWMCPNELLVLVEADTQAQVEADLRATMAGQHIAVSDLSSGQTLINLSGDNVEEVMMKSTVYDCHESNFPVGKAVQTTFAKAGATIYKCADGSYDLIIRRSFSDYIFLWLKDACAEYGLAVS